MRRIAAVVLTMALGAGAVACTSDAKSDGEKSGGAGTEQDASATAGLIDPKDWKAQQDEYLDFAAGQDLSPGSPLSLLAHVEHDVRAGKRPDVRAVSPDDFTDTFEKLKRYDDTGDFDIDNLLNLYLRDGKYLPASTDKAIRDRILAFKYWWTEPTPKGIVDSQYYWTENHQIIYLANEYIAGQTFPHETFTNNGKDGDWHRKHAVERLRTWFTYRARFGFSEWLSNVYWAEDFKGLLLLAEFAEDPEIARLASMTLDLLFVELAAHIQKGTFGATHGRTYEKDKLQGVDEDTFSIAKLAFDATPHEYVDADNATLLAVASKYRPPEVAKRIAHSKDTTIFKMRAGVPLDPNAPVDPKVEAPYGLSWKGEDALMLWWGMGAQFPWQVAPLSVETVKKYDLFKTANFKKAADLEPVVATADDATVRNLAHSLAIQVNPGLLSQVDTYTYRSPDVMLSTAQDWRPGQRNEQAHTWQATIDADALVFTNHPREAPDPTQEYGDNGVWTGDGALPRSAQYQNVSMSIYAPQYDGGGGIGSGAYSFTYEPYTHAYFPTEKFDEVVQKDGWTIGRKGAGFIALWSLRPTTWRSDIAPEVQSHGELHEKYDLMAPGGPDNVWITEVARASDYSKAGAAIETKFSAFVDAITSSKVSATRPSESSRCTGAPCAKPSISEGFEVSYDSPSRGKMRFGWTPTGPDDHAPADNAPLMVDGREVPLHTEGAELWNAFLAGDEPGAPWAVAPWNTQRFSADYDGAALSLDFRKGTRATAKSPH